MEQNSPHVLVILDGYGQRKEREFNAIAHARKPNLDTWFSAYPHTTLLASGNAVGLPEGYMGNSEVGHLTIGAGRHIPQTIMRINELIRTQILSSHKVVLDGFTKIKEGTNRLHLIGLLSDAGVHAHINHLKEFIAIAKKIGINKVFLHAILDGRDTPPRSAHNFLNAVEQIGGVTISTLHGRYFAMDRDKHWSRTEKSYRALTQKENLVYSGWQDALNAYYQKDVTDQFIPPTQINHDGIIQNGDGILFFNFRPDRARQLTASFSDPNFREFKQEQIELACFITPVVFDPRVPTDHLLEPVTVSDTLKEVLNDAGKNIYAIAETEKYAHVTYFFNGGKEDILINEMRILIPSIPSRDYVAEPCMSAPEITKTVIKSLQAKPRDFYLINYANADMVGHSGNFGATIKAIECLDTQLKELHEQVVEKMNGTLYITADHGNAEDMYYTDINQPRTAHTTHPVPFLMIRKELKNAVIQLDLKELCDIAPFILKQMGVTIPDEMKK